MQRESIVARLLSDAVTGLPATEPVSVEAYKASLALDAVSQPYITAGVDRFGGMVGGGIAFNFSDMLGNHNLYAQVSADTYGGGAGDLAEEHRRGRSPTRTCRSAGTGAFAVEQSPVHRRRLRDRSGRRRRRAGAARSDDHPAAGQPRRQRHGGVSRSARRRAIEFGGGFTRTSFDRQIRTTAISLRTGRVLDDSTDTTPLADPLSMSSVSTALVTDSSIFGATSPVAGTRSRFEVSPTFGDLQMTTALADYRHYFMPARFYTIAVRGMHYGRYGDGR